MIMSWWPHHLSHLQSEGNQASHHQRPDQTQLKLCSGSKHSNFTTSDLTMFSWVTWSRWPQCPGPRCRRPALSSRAWRRTPWGSAALSPASWRQRNAREVCMSLQGIKLHHWLNELGSRFNWFLDSEPNIYVRKLTLLLQLWRMQRRTDCNWLEGCWCFVGATIMNY